MGKIFYNRSAIPIPERCYIDRSDGRVLAKILDADGKYRRRTIGVLSTENTMYPNELFQQRYRDLWEKYYPSKSFKEYELSVGMYGLFLGIAHHIKLYDLLHDLYGESNVNYILDYAMYSCLYRDDTTQLYPERMRRELLFAEQVYSDDWYSDFFHEQMSENVNHKFREQWLHYCHDAGVTKAWLCIDGTNNDCEVKKSPLTEQGNAKSHSHSDIVGYMYVVSATDGRPITYYTYEGSKPDHSAFHQIAQILNRANIELAGVILDAGFCTNEVITTLEECSMEYVIMMHSNHLGHTDAVAEFGESIKWSPEYMVADDGVFGISCMKQLFKTHTRQGYVNVFYDAVRGTRESIDFSRKLRAEKRRLEALIQIGKAFVISPAYSKYLELQTDENGIQKISYRYDQWKKDANAKGFFSILSSSDFGAEAVYETYHLRDASETAYSLLKSQQGLDTTRVHSTVSIQSKFAIGFITSIMRTEIEIACHNFHLDTNAVIQKLDHVHVFLAPGNTYMFSKSIRKDLADLLSSFGMTSDRFDALASEINIRLDSQYRNRYRGIPNSPHPDRDRKPKNQQTHDKEDNIQTKRELQTRTTDETENRLLTESGTKPAKKRPGRKKGTKDSYQRKRRTKAELAHDRNMKI